MRWLVAFVRDEQGNYMNTTRRVLQMVLIASAIGRQERKKLFMVCAYLNINILIERSPKFSKYLLWLYMKSLLSILCLTGTKYSKKLLFLMHAL